MKTIIILIAVIFFIQSNSFSQCSDAGVCKIGGHSTNDKKDNTTSFNSIIGLQYGYANSGNPGKTDYNGLELFGNLYTGKNTGFSFSVPFLVQDKIAGLGDAVITGTYNHQINNTSRFDFTAGFKVATSKVGNNFGYLNGYGTNDFLAGINYIGKFYNFGAGAQIPLTKYSDDNVEFKRGPDLLLKAGYFRTISNVTFNLDALLIKRISESEITNKGTSTTATISKSNFTQLNIMGGVNISVSQNLNLGISAGVPLLKRDENSDGTKRAIFFNMGLGYKFNL